MPENFKVVCGNASTNIRIVIGDSFSRSFDVEGAIEVIFNSPAFSFTIPLKQLGAEWDLFITRQQTETVEPGAYNYQIRALYDGDITRTLVEGTITFLPSIFPTFRTPPVVIHEHNPTAADNRYGLGTLWFNKEARTLWVLYSNIDRVASWRNITSESIDDLYNIEVKVDGLNDIVEEHQEQITFLLSEVTRIYSLTAHLKERVDVIEELKIPSIQEAINKLVSDINNLYNTDISQIRDDIVSIKQELSTVVDVDLKDIYQMIDDIENMVAKIYGVEIEGLRKAVEDLNARADDIEVELNNRIETGKDAELGEITSPTTQRLQEELTDLTTKVDELDIPTNLTDLNDNINARLVTDEQIGNWDSKVSQEQINEFITRSVEDLENFYDKETVTNMLNELKDIIPSFKIEVVDVLPNQSSADSLKIYLLREDNTFTKYIWYNNEWLSLGVEEVDLSDVVRSGDDATLGSITATQALLRGHTRVVGSSFRASTTEAHNSPQLGIASNGEVVLNGTTVSIGSSAVINYQEGNRASTSSNSHVVIGKSTRSTVSIGGSTYSPTGSGSTILNHMSTEINSELLRVNERTITSFNGVVNLNGEVNYSRLNTIEEDINNLSAKIPTNLSQLSQDSNHRLVTDEQILSWVNQEALNYVSSKVNSNHDYLNSKIEQRATKYELEKVRDLILSKTIIKVVDELPTEDISETTIYLVKNLEDGVASQYMYVEGAWVSIGSTDANLEALEFLEINSLPQEQVSYDLYHSEEVVLESLLRNMVFDIPEELSNVFEPYSEGSRLIRVLPPYDIHRYMMSADFTVTLNNPSPNRNSQVMMQIILGQDGWGGRYHIASTTPSADNPTVNISKTGSIRDTDTTQLGVTVESRNINSPETAGRQPLLEGETLTISNFKLTITFISNDRLSLKALDGNSCLSIFPDNNITLGNSRDINGFMSISDEGLLIRGNGRPVHISGGGQRFGIQVYTAAEFQSEVAFNTRLTSRGGGIWFEDWNESFQANMFASNGGSWASPSFEINTASNDIGPARLLFNGQRVITESILNEAVDNIDLSDVIRTSSNAVLGSLEANKVTVKGNEVWHDGNQPEKLSVISEQDIEHFTNFGQTEETQEFDPTLFAGINWKLTDTSIISTSEWGDNTLGNIFEPTEWCPPLEEGVANAVQIILFRAGDLRDFTFKFRVEVELVNSNPERQLPAPVQFLLAQWHTPTQEIGEEWFPINAHTNIAKVEKGKVSTVCFEVSIPKEIIGGDWSIDDKYKVLRHFASGEPFNFLFNPNVEVIAGTSALDASERIVVKNAVIECYVLQRERIRSSSIGSSVYVWDELRGQEAGRNLDDILSAIDSNTGRKITRNSHAQLSGLRVENINTDDFSLISRIAAETQNVSTVFDILPVGLQITNNSWTNPMRGHNSITVFPETGINLSSDTQLTINTPITSIRSNQHMEIQGGEVEISNTTTRINSNVVLLDGDVRVNGKEVENLWSRSYRIENLDVVGIAMVSFPIDTSKSYKVTAIYDFHMGSEFPLHPYVGIFPKNSMQGFQILLMDILVSGADIVRMYRMGGQLYLEIGSSWLDQRESVTVTITEIKDNYETIVFPRGLSEEQTPEEKSQEEVDKDIAKLRSENNYIKTKIEEYGREKYYEEGPNEKRRFLDECRRRFKEEYTSTNNPTES